MWHGRSNWRCHRSNHRPAPAKAAPPGDVQPPGRSFLQSGATPAPGYAGNLKDIVYTVTRIFLGTVNPNTAGVNVIEGRMAAG